MNRFWVVWGWILAGFGVDLDGFGIDLGGFSCVVDIYGGRVLMRRNVPQVSLKLFPKCKLLKRKPFEGLRSSLPLSALPVLARKGFFFALGRSWGDLVRTCGGLGPSWMVLGRSWIALGWSWIGLRPVLERSSAVLGRLEAVLERSWAVLGHLGAVWGRLGELKTLMTGSAFKRWTLRGRSGGVKD